MVHTPPTPSPPSTAKRAKADLSEAGDDIPASSEQAVPPDEVQPLQTSATSTESTSSQHQTKPAPPSRVIDETTDMTTLTDQEIMNLMEGMGEEEVLAKPLISPPVPLSVLMDEYRTGSPQVLKKLDWLQNHGWDQVWRSRRDGDCFYRSYLLRILHSSSPDLTANLAHDAIQRALPAMEECGFDKELYEEFLEPLLHLIQAFAPEDGESTMTEYAIIESLQDPERSNCIVVALRLITSSYIRTNPDTFSPFLFSPTTLLPTTPDDFCRQEVEPCGREADHAQLMALAEALNVGIRVAYLDRSEIKASDSGEGDVINWVEFGKEEGRGEESWPLSLLYRPGHFDVVTKDAMTLAAAAGSSV